MANTTIPVPIAVVQWGDDKMVLPLAATAAVYYPGAMIAIDASGNAVKCDDTAGIQFAGINAEGQNVQVFSGEAAGDRSVLVKRPWRFECNIASAAAGDEGTAVYAKYDNEVAYSGVSNSILVGWVDRVISSTRVLINPTYGPLTNLSVASNTLTFAGSTGANTIVVPDNLADGLSVVEGANAYLTFKTTNSAETMIAAKQLRFADSVKLCLGDADDITVAWDGTDLDVLQATANSSIKWGVDGAGIDHVFYGDTASAALTWDQSADSLILSGVAKIKHQTIAAATGTAVPVTHSGSFPVTQNGAETNTLADPTYLGQTISIFVDTDTSGARVITAASRINQAGNTIITLTEVGDFIKLEAITIAGALKWQVVANDGAALS